MRASENRVEKDINTSEVRLLINEHILIFETLINKISGTLSAIKVELPQILNAFMPRRLRIHDLCHEIVTYTDAKIDEDNLIEYFTAYQAVSVLQYNELKAIKVFLLFSILDNLYNILLENSADKDDITRSKVIIRNSICSISIIDAIDWQNFLENNNSVDQILCRCTTGIYDNMDFFSRDRYRNEISKLAGQSRLTELDVARSVLLLSKRSTDASKRRDRIDIGEFLIGRERKQLEKFLGIQLTFKERIINFYKKNSLPSYLVSIGLLTILPALFCLYILSAGEMSTGLLLPTCLLLVLGLSHTAKQFIDAIASASCLPQSLPTLDFSKRIPSEYKTLVTIPSLLTSEQEIDRLVHQLKIFFIGNKTSNLYFSLLTDYTDSATEQLPGDAALIRLVKSRITDLNKEFCAADKPRFFLFHRPRKWNEADGIWMGHERKRGKLMDLNDLLRNPDNDSFSELIVDKSVLSDIKYVITLDADTQLPRDSAWRLVAAMAHPLNRAVYCEEKRRTIAGYGMLQPKIGMDLRGLNNSIYEHIHGSGPDIDPYTSVSPDVYQDLFDEGSYMGKGIYDVDIINKALANRLPDNRILSHDLLEGSYVRTGFLSNVKLHEQTVDYWTSVKRRERWIRGDWQIASWIFPLVPGFGGTRTKNPLSALSRWKIFDNLRNSLIPVCQLILIICGWLLFKEPLKLSIVVLLIAFSPSLCLFITKLFKKPEKLLRKGHWIAVLNDSYSCFLQDVYVFICLPFEAAYTFVAVIRACWRLIISGHKRLEWQPSSGSKSQRSQTLLGTYQQMWFNPFVAAVVSFYLIINNFGLIFFALPVLILWLLAPAIAYLTNRQRPEKKTVLSAEQQQLIKRLSRKTWAYFDDQVTEAVNWLPPDHIQEYPELKVAYYTSPTNIGLCVLSYLTAFDLGYIPAGNLIERTAHTLHSMQSLERYKGHFYNWYDIKTLAASKPRYVSTVDSGNLAGHLITLRQGLADLSKNPVFTNQQFDSLVDVLNMIDWSEEKSPLLQECKKYLAGISNAPVYPGEALRQPLDKLDAYMKAITILVTSTTNDSDRYWLNAFVTQVHGINHDLKAIAPWLFIDPCPASLHGLIPEPIPTLGELANWELPDAITNKDRKLTTEEIKWLNLYIACMEKAKSAAGNRLKEISLLITLCSDLAEQEYEFLYKPSSHMLSIGYKVEEDCLDADCYDMLASEARLATYVGVCQNKLPVKSWFLLGRPLIVKNGQSVLLSANGTMFEYLMPNLIMPVFKDTILDYACTSAVDEQIGYGKEQDIPWGISESCYGSFDDALNYQYRVFGIPSLSLKRHHVVGDRVISPYATALSLLVNPEKAGSNLEVLSSNGAEGRYGLYEAVDYTVSRLGKGESKNVIRSFMVHHQGMSFLAFAHVLLDKRMQKRFLDDAEMESGVFLLQEKLPEDAAFHHQTFVESAKKEQIKAGEHVIPATLPSDFSVPEVQLLSNGRYHIVLTNSEDCHNCFHFNTEQEEYWYYETLFHEGYAVFKRFSNETESKIKVIVSHDDNMQIRSLSIKNTSDKYKKINIIARLPDSKESWHNEALPEKGTILCYETNEMFNDQYSCHFISLHVNSEVELNKAFSTDAGAIRYSIHVSPGETITAVMTAGVAESREQAFELIDLSATSTYVEKLFKQSAILGTEQLKQIGISKDDARLFRQLTGSLLFGEDARIACGDIEFERLTTGTKDVCILLRIDNVENVEAIVTLIKLHQYWRLNGLTVKVLVLNEDQGCYKNFLQKLIIETITNSVGGESLNRHGSGIFIKMPDHLTTEDQLLLRSVGYSVLLEEEEVEQRQDRSDKQVAALIL